ncbi:hypothetical protein PtrV1_04039 [Pyrenophora tritici-repentis]|nr:hypothetical protein PtrV1_04039 [Pyrenophora tritici-repentis]KAI1515088.1 hypothetical protein Ptr86124_006411 [Pyrenophora tritici-repentis]KAI1522860.1 hypothetical protein PtrSN001A_011556 [Pyrenophora tritici-repentis]KAI1672739.1 hypothetical protein L13192_03598 [Pyrenophora tritici-repentis]PZC88434.1 hypothetical protein A1F95_10922 [Pyrenophora tritici-repentis]
MPIAVKENVCEQYSHLPDHEGDQQARLKYSENFIMPLEDPNFLRKKNPLLFAMCHLYDALRQLGYLDTAWVQLDKVMSLHISSLFLGQVRTESPRSMANRAFLDCGAPPELFRSSGSNRNRREKNFEKLLVKSTNKSGAFDWSPMMAIVADHLHDREPLRRTLFRLDEEMVAQESKATGRSNTKSFLENSDPIAFLERLRDQVKHFNLHFAADYYGPVRTCGGLFETMVPDDEQQKGHSVQNPATADLCAVLSILGELAVLSERARPGTPAEKSPVATHIAGVLKNYIQGGMSVAELHSKFKYRESE